MKASQAIHQLETWQIWAGEQRVTAPVVRGTPGLVKCAGREATVKVCGVVVAMLQGHSWAPTLSKVQA